MKKILWINIIIVVLFIVFDPMLNFCTRWADVNNSGAEMFLGMIIPVVFACFIGLTMYSIGYSIFESFAKKNIKLLLPILIFVFGTIFYILISNQESLWIRYINYCLANWS